MILNLFGKPPAPVILPARSSDAAGLAGVHAAGFERAWGESDFEALLADRAVLCHVAKPGGRGKPGGFVMSRHAAGEAEILSVAVLPGMRGLGLGRQLMMHHLGALAGLRVSEIFLEVAEDNPAAIHLYRRLGFEEKGRRPAYYQRRGGAPASALIMRRALT